jgi:hypothetical protein
MVDGNVLGPLYRIVRSYTRGLEISRVEFTEGIFCLVEEFDAFIITEDCKLQVIHPPYKHTQTH